MKRYLYNTLRGAALALVAASVASCGGDREIPPMIIPTAPDGMEATTTIAEVKERYYDASGYTFTFADPIGQLDDGTDQIVKARVISNDATGNIFKRIYVADETGAIQININAYDLYESYQYGQEVFINLTGLYAGAYGRLIQIGGFSSATSSPARLETDVMDEHAYRNGLGQPSKIDTLTVGLDVLKAATAGTPDWFKYQSQLVRVNDVYFVDAGQATLSTSGSSGVSRTLKDAAGNSIVLYTSGYADEDIYDYICPAGTGDVVGILSFYNATWQLVILNLDGLIGFTPVDHIVVEEQPDPSGSGTLADPYNIARALEIINAGTYTNDKVYLKGIVSEINSIDTSYGNATYYLSDTGSTAVQLEIYRGYSLNGDKFTSTDEIKVGDELVIYGQLTMYNTTPEVTTGSSIISINGSTSL
ncbi:MAG: DUF5689 domain-containing protein [Bacteroidales bacterium]|nr:DUF5689 domain-containing protein [Bacteroidales bacterium]